MRADYEETKILIALLSRVLARLVKITISFIKKYPWLFQNISVVSSFSKTIPGLGNKFSHSLTFPGSSLPYKTCKNIWIKFILLCKAKIDKLFKCKQHSQVEHQHGPHHHDEAAEGGVKVDYTEQDGGARHRVHPVQPVLVLLLLVQDLPSLGIHLDFLVAAAINLGARVHGVWLVRLGQVLGWSDMLGGGSHHLTGEGKRDVGRVEQ